MIRVALIVTVHCTHRRPDGTTCPRFDEHAERPFASERAIVAARDAAAAAFRGRGWTFDAAGHAHCSDHPAPSPRKEPRP